MNGTATPRSNPLTERDIAGLMRVDEQAAAVEQAFEAIVRAMRCRGAQDANAVAIRDLFTDAAHLIRAARDLAERAWDAEMDAATMAELQERRPLCGG